MVPFRGDARAGGLFFDATTMPQFPLTRRLSATWRRVTPVSPAARP